MAREMRNGGFGVPLTGGLELLRVGESLGEGWLPEAARPGEGRVLGVELHGDAEVLVPPLLPLEARGEGAAHGVRQPLPLRITALG